MIREAGGTASFRRTDIWVAAEVEALVEHAMTTYGRRRRFRQTARAAAKSGARPGPPSLISNLEQPTTLMKRTCPIVRRRPGGGAADMEMLQQSTRGGRQRLDSNFFAHHL